MKRWNTDAAGRESSTDPDEGDDGDDVRFKCVWTCYEDPPPPLLSFMISLSHSFIRYVSVRFLKILIV